MVVDLVVLYKISIIEFVLPSDKYSKYLQDNKIEAYCFCLRNIYLLIKV